MIEVSPSFDLLLQQPSKFNGLGFANDITYIFDYTKPEILYQFTHGINEGYMTTPSTWEFQLADFFKQNMKSWANPDFKSSSWTPLNIHPQMRQTVNINMFKLS